jgi:hypothetical protein
MLLNPDRPTGSLGNNFADGAAPLGRDETGNDTLKLK